MRVVFFSRDYTPHDHRFLEGLAKTDHEVFFLRLEDRGLGLEDRDLPQAVTPLTWAGGKETVGLLDGWRLIFDLRRLIREVKPDLIHAGPIQRSAFLVALSGFKPLVSMSWGYDLLIDARKNPFWSWATRFTLKRSAAFVGDCETIRGIAVEHGMKESRIVTFPWGVDLEHFSPPSGASSVRDRLGWGDKEFVIISTRSFSPLYGIMDIAHAFVKAVKKNPELRLLMLGKGPQEPEVKKMFVENGVSNQVHMAGQVSKSQLPSYYQAADLYLSASQSDGSSISLLEAFASGLPVLLSDIPGNKDWVRDNADQEVGWLFSEGDVTDLERGIRRAVRNREELSSLGQASRRLAEKEADWEQNFPKLFKAYRIAAGQDLSGQKNSG